MHKPAHEAGCLYSWKPLWYSWKCFLVESTLVNAVKKSCHPIRHWKTLPIIFIRACWSCKCVSTLLTPFRVGFRKWCWVCSVHWERVYRADMFACGGHTSGMVLTRALIMMAC